MIKIEFDNKNLLKDTEDYEEYTENVVVLTDEEKKVFGLQKKSCGCKGKSKKK